MIPPSLSPDIHPVNYAIKYNPPTIVLQYYLGSNPAQEFAHPVKLNIPDKANAKEIVQELLRVEDIYFNARVVSEAQVFLIVNLMYLAGKTCPENHR